MVDVTYTMTKAEFVSMQKLAPGQPAVVAKVNMLALMVSALIGAFFILRLCSASSSVADLLLALLSPVMLFCLVVCGWFSQGRRMRRAYKAALPALTKVRLLLDRNGYADQTADGNSQLRWSAFSAWGENDLVFVLHLRGLLVGVPKAALTSFQMGELREILQEHVRSAPF